MSAPFKRGDIVEHGVGLGIVVVVESDDVGLNWGGGWFLPKESSYL